MAEGTLTIKFLGDPSKLKSDFDNLGTAAGTFEGKIEGAGSKFGNFATVASGIVAAGALQKIGGFLKDGATGAMEDAAAMDRLKTAVENTGVSFDTRSKSIDEAIKKGQELAFSDGDVMSALTNLTNATGDSDEALRRLTLAQDLARGTGMSLEQASKLLGKTSDENTATLARYGIQLDKNATAQDVMNEVDKRFGGQAAAFAESDAGKWAQLQLQMTELQETIGGMLIPVFATLVTVFSGVMTALEPVTTFIGENIKPIMLGLAAAIATVVIPAFVAWALAAGAAAIATLTAMAPIILTAAAIGAAVAALYLAWSTNFLGIRDITQQVIDYVRPYIEGALTAIQAAFDTVLPYITTAVDTAWKAIQAVFETIFPIIQTIVETYILAWQTIIETALGIIRGVFETVFPAIQAVVETVFPIIKTVVETYIGLVLGIITTTLDAIGLIWGPFWDGIKAVTTAVWDAASGIAGIVQTGIFAVKDIVGRVLGELRDVVWVPTWDGIKATVTTVWDAASGIVGAVTTGIQGVYDAVSGKLTALRDTVWNPIWNGLKGTVDGVISAVRDAWNFVAGIANRGISTWNNLSLNFDTGIPGLPTIHWDSPNLPLLPIIGEGGGSGANGGPQAESTTQLPSGGWTSGGGQKPPPGMTSGGGQKPVPVTPGIGAPVSNGYIDPLSMGNLSGGGNLGSAGRSGGRGTSMSQEQADTAAQLIAQGVPADQAIAAATSAGSTGAGGGRSGGVVFNSAAGYRRVQMANGMTGYVATGKDDEWFGGGGLSIIMDGFRVGRLVGDRHVQGARMRRSPVGCGG